MKEENILIRKWIVFGGIAGILSVLSYTIAITGFSDNIALICGFIFGPLLSFAYLGLYRFFALHKKSILIQVSTIFGVIAGTIVNMMIVVQSAIHLTIPPESRDGLGLAWDGLNMVQLGLDVSWDIYFTSATILLGIAMFSHPRFGMIWGILTIIIGAALLVLNLLTFPIPPANSGLIDLGPVSGILYLIISIRVIMSLKWVDHAISVRTECNKISV